jgi:hypothetical protein
MTAYSTEGKESGRRPATGKPRCGVKLPPAKRKPATQAVSRRGGFSNNNNSGLKSAGPPFAVADAVRFFDGGNKNLSIADLPGAR